MKKYFVEGGYFLLMLVSSYLWVTKLIETNANFWSAFYPGFVASFICIFIGIPIALLVNSIGDDLRAGDEKEKERKQAAKSLRLLSKAIEENIKVLSSLSTTIDTNHIKLLTEIDYEIWDTVKSYIIQHLDDIELQKDLTFLFFRFRNVKEYDDRYFYLASGIVQANPEIVNAVTGFYPDIIKGTKSMADTANKRIKNVLSSKDWVKYN